MRLFIAIVFLCMPLVSLAGDGGMIVTWMDYDIIKRCPNLETMRQFPLEHAELARDQHVTFLSEIPTLSVKDGESGIWEMNLGNFWIPRLAWEQAESMQQYWTHEPRKVRHTETSPDGSEHQYDACIYYGKDESTSGHYLVIYRIGAE